MCTPFDAPRVHDFLTDYMRHASVSWHMKLSLRAATCSCKAACASTQSRSLFFAVSHKLRPSAAFQREALTAFHRAIAKKVFWELDQGIDLVPKITTQPTAQVVVSLLRTGAVPSTLHLVVTGGRPKRNSGMDAEVFL